MLLELSIAIGFVGCSATADRQTMRPVQERLAAVPDGRGKPLSRPEAPEPDAAARTWIWAPYLFRDPASPQERERPNIDRPGPDTANFPNSAFTLPEGRFYFENSPVGYYAAGRLAPAQYNWEVFFRYGLTDNLELRLFTNGLSIVEHAPPTIGFGPLTFDIKYRLWEQNPRYGIPAAAVETYVQTTWGSPALADGTQFAWSFNFDHSLPLNITLEWNIGVAKVFGSGGRELVAETLSWALEHDLSDDIALFIHGYHNGAALPRGSTLNFASARGVGTLDGQAFGAGATWTVGENFEVFGSANAGIQDAPGFIGLAGFAAAF